MDVLFLSSTTQPLCAFSLERAIMPEAQSLQQKKDEIHNADDRVLVVPARAALKEYYLYAAYICQAHRSFRNCARMAFYFNNKIDRHIPQIVSHVTAISLDEIETRTDITDADRARLCILLTRLETDRKKELEKGQRDIYFLTPPDSPETLTLPQDIENNTTTVSGKSIAFTQGHRYISLSALEKGPQYTNELT